MHIKTTGADGKPYQLQIHPGILVNHSIIGGILVIQCRPNGTHKTKSTIGTWTWTKAIKEIHNWPEVKAYLENVSEPEKKPSKNNNQPSLF